MGISSQGVTPRETVAPDIHNETLARCLRSKDGENHIGGPFCAE